MIRTPSAILLAAMATALAGTAGAQPVLTHHMRDTATGADTARLASQLPASHVMALDLVLAVRDQAGLDKFLEDVYDPDNASYRHFLTVAEFTDKFGPSKSDYAAVVAYAKQHGLTVTGGSRDGMEVQVKGPVSAVEAAFHVKMQTFTRPGKSGVFFAPDREPTVDLPFSLWHISGLDNFSDPRPLYVNRLDYAKAKGVDPDSLIPQAGSGTGSGPSGSYLGSDMRAAYYGSGALTGAGQNLGLFEYLGTDLADLNTYFTNVGQTNNVPITLLSTDGTSTSCIDSAAGGRCDDTEQTLDMTQAIGMAPGLASLTMYIGSLDTAIISSITTHSPLPTTIGCSWEWRPADPTTLDPYFEKMSAQGQNFFVASGDNQNWATAPYVWPSDDAHVVTVGGTDLVTSSAAGPWKSETAWIDSGGGISPNGIKIPAWQKYKGVITTANGGSTTVRNGPDISANANFTFYTCADQKACNANLYGGTSFAAPMWAGFIALVNEERANAGSPTLGYINPTVYKRNITPSLYALGFHDILTGTNDTFSATKGYDLVTGWGSPKPALVNALAK